MKRHINYMHSTMAKATWKVDFSQPSRLPCHYNTAHAVYGLTGPESIFNNKYLNCRFRIFTREPLRETIWRYDDFQHVAYVFFHSWIPASASKHSSFLVQRAEMKLKTIVPWPISCRDGNVKTTGCCMQHLREYYF